MFGDLVRITEEMSAFLLIKTMQCLSAGIYSYSVHTEFYMD